MGALSKTKELCKLRNVSIRTLEQDLGFGNGYIGAKNKDELPFDRVVKIANYFNVPIEYFISDEPGSQQKVDEATKLYSMYVQASPDIRSAIETLLKSQGHDF